MTKSIIWSIVGPGLLAHCAIICGWKNRIMPVQAQSAASGRSGGLEFAGRRALSDHLADGGGDTFSIWATQTSQSSCIAISTISCSLESPT